MTEVEIYFDDLKPEAQKEVLKLYEMEDSREGNFEIVPLAVLTKSFDITCSEKELHSLGLF